MKKEKKYLIRARIWIDEINGSFLGSGRVLLLENIGKTGSITNAAKELKMAYRQAWQLVQDMNNLAEQPLVEKILGGKTGGGAILTAAGERAIETFYRLEKRVNEFIEKENKKIKF